MDQTFFALCLADFVGREPPEIVFFASTFGKAETSLLSVKAIALIAAIFLGVAYFEDFGFIVEEIALFHVGLIFG